MGSALYGKSALGSGTPETLTPPISNGISEGGKPGVLQDFTSLAVYASDAPAIRNNMFQMARRIQQLEAALKAAGIPV